MIKIKIKNKKKLDEVFEPLTRNYGLALGTTSGTLGGRTVLMIIDIEALKFKFKTDIKYSPIFNKYAESKVPADKVVSILDWDIKSDKPRRYPTKEELTNSETYERYKDAASTPPFIIAGIELIENARRCSNYKTMTVSRAARFSGENQKGIGKILYKYAIAYASSKDSYITSDRVSVSPGAEKNWQDIFNFATSENIEVKKLNPELDANCIKKTSDLNSPLNHLYKSDTYGRQEFNSKLQLGNSALTDCISGDVKNIMADAFEKLFRKEYNKYLE